MTADVPALRVEGLAVTYDANPVLWDINLHVPRGTTMAIVGPNGAGKSTLLKAILGLIPVLAGRIEVLGKTAADRPNLIGYVPQRTAVDWDFPITVRDLVLMGTYGRLGWFRRPGRQQREEARAALEKVELSDLGDRQIGELSGGQQQRAFLARAFVQDTPLYLMDEPFAGVDIVTEKALARLLGELGQKGKTIVVVHHDLTTVREYFDHVTLLNREVFASGPVSEAFGEALIQRTYRGPEAGQSMDQPNA